MRVNRTRNLALLVPGLCLLLSLYFLIFSLFLDATVFNLFQIPYFKLIGVEDAVLGLLHLGALVLVGTFALWLVYSVILAIAFFCLLTVHMVGEVKNMPISLGRKITVVLISLTVLSFNMLMRVLLIVPFSGRVKDGEVKVSDKRFSRAFINLQNKDGELRAGRPFLAAKAVFQRYLFFKEVGNHKFFSFTLILVGLSLAIGYQTWREAQKTLTCELAAPLTDDKTSSLFSLSPACAPQGQASIFTQLLF
ncbi:hypothetical protein [Sneathiella limimaris]|uniref:hypothetical protein n=1 Tax=Sneathiella limimaris TaxID=1964213 RepID=UPI00146D034E|nr:hypothetical protein [Sneathiella limimaris]